MPTAAARLAQLSGLGSATAAAHLLAIGTGSTAAQILVAYSGVGSATAAVHLMTDAAQPQPEPGFSGWHQDRPRRRRPHEEDEAILLAILH